MFSSEHLEKITAHSLLDRARINPKAKKFSFDAPESSIEGEDGQMRVEGTAIFNSKSDARLLTTSHFDDFNYSAVILAGGDGARLSSFTREIYGYHLPKQF